MSANIETNEESKVRTEPTETGKSVAKHMICILDLIGDALDTKETAKLFIMGLIEAKQQNLLDEMNRLNTAQLAKDESHLPGDEQIKEMYKHATDLVSYMPDLDHDEIRIWAMESSVALFSALKNMLPPESDDDENEPEAVES